MNADSAALYLRRAYELMQTVRRARAPPAFPAVAGVRVKADRKTPSYHLRSKGEADILIREQTGPGSDHLAALRDVRSRRSIPESFAGLLALIPLIFPLARPNARLQLVLRTMRRSPI